MKNRLFALILLSLAVELPCVAQQVIQDKNGSSFMEEVPDKNAPPQGRVIRSSPPPSSQVIKQDDGSIFMEEVPQKKKAQQKYIPPIDYSSLGVPVDANGKIIPLIQPDAGPVMTNGSRMEVEYTPRTLYVPYQINNGPYGYVPPNIGVAPGPMPLYRSPMNGILAVPLGIPNYYSSSSDLPPDQQQINYGSSGSSYNFAPVGNIWSPSWRSPWGKNLWLPQETQFQQSGSIRSIFPKNMNKPDDQ